MAILRVDLMDASSSNKQPAGPTPPALARSRRTIRRSTRVTTSALAASRASRSRRRPASAGCIPSSAVVLRATAGGASTCLSTKRRTAAGSVGSPPIRSPPTASAAGRSHAADTQPRRESTLSRRPTSAPRCSGSRARSDPSVTWASSRASLRRRSFEWRSRTNASCVARSARSASHRAWARSEQQTEAVASASAAGAIR
mmetsp:Transcript_20027/g.64346  ORF Transcript_20027/g.64346 Transcript_20027/m.64346 type:complete len:200 (-) Transcript_20027:157-756(-)